MISAEDFTVAASQFNFKRYVGVPCSFLTPLINHAINNPRLEHISSANEGDAVATAAGSTIGGKPAIVIMQNSGLGNAVSPITSLAQIFRIPLLIITTQRGRPGIKDEPQHALMGEITPAMLEMMQVSWQAFPTDENQIVPALQTAIDHMDTTHRPYGLIMQKGDVAECPLNNIHKPERRTKQESPQYIPRSGAVPSRAEALELIINHTPSTNTVVITTTGYTGRELFSICDRDNHLYMVGSMGCASSLGLGLACARPDLHIVIIDGDGAALMRMGNFATLGSYGNANLTHILLDNEMHESTGGQATVSANVEFANIAMACNYGNAYKGESLTVLETLFKDIHQGGGIGARFCHLKIQSGVKGKLPRPNISPPEQLRRLIKYIGTDFN